MNRKPRKATFIALTVITSMLIAAWVHSHIGGWRNEWSNPDTLTGGRIVSSKGQLYYQRCSLKPSGLSAALNGEQHEPTKMPVGFSVGSNPKGRQTVITIAKYPIAFTDPHPRQWFNLHNQETNRNSKEDGFWYANRREFLIAYWLATLIPALMLLSEFRKWYLFRRTSHDNNKETA
jgi:hypothetical protein